MATVSASVILQAKSTLPSDGYPSATVGSNGWDTVTCAPGDTVNVSVRSGNADLSGTVGTVNYGHAPTGNTGTGGTLTGASNLSSTSTVVTVSVSNVQQSGYISIWCSPSQDGSSVGWRARVYVTVNHTSSISTNKSTYADGETVTVNWSTTYSGTKYYNSTGAVQDGNNRFNPKDGSVGSGFSGSFNTTAVGPSSGSWTGDFTLRLGDVTGTEIARSNTVTISAPPPVVTAPTLLTFSAAGTESATTSVTVTASGGTNGTMEVSSNGSTWVANGTAFSRTRGTNQTWYARTRGTTTSGNYTDSYTVPYLTADLSVAATSSTIAFTATSATTTISGVDRASENVAVRVNNGSTNLATRNGNGSINFSSSLPPGPGNFSIYEIFTRRPTSTGGDGVTWYGTNDTFTVTRAEETVTTPTVNNTQTFNTTTEAATFSHTTSLSSSGSGGTLEYNWTESTGRNINNPSTTLPTSGWTTNPTRNLERGYYYHFWARRSVGSGDRTNTALQAPYIPTDLNATVAPSFDISVNSTSFAIGIANPEPNHAYRFGTNTSYGEITGPGSPYTTGVIDPQGFASITIPDTASHYPSVDSPKRYYLYASRTETSGGSGGTGSFSSPGWYYTGSSVLVSMTSGGGGTPVPGGSGDYGLQIRNANGAITLDVSSRTTNRVIASSVLVPRDQTPSATINFPGMTPTNLDTHIVILPELFTGYAYRVNRGTNSFTISTIFTTFEAARNVSYVAVRYG